MDNSISILDSDYILCVKELLKRYRSSKHLGISEYELEKPYHAKIDGTMQTIKEIETKLDSLK